MDASEQWFTLDNSPGPIWGSRGREFKSRQPDKVKDLVGGILATRSQPHISRSQPVVSAL
jgi:hypothetical protein